jgi:glutamine amidotransferase-like uncharacterized protein
MSVGVIGRCVDVAVGVGGTIINGCCAGCAFGGEMTCVFTPLGNIVVSVDDIDIVPSAA